MQIMDSLFAALEGKNIDEIIAEGLKNIDEIIAEARDQESEGVVSIDPAFGTLCLVYRDESRMHFVKYLSKSAPSDRYDIAFTYRVREDEEENDEEEE